MRLNWSAMRRIANFQLIGMAAEKKFWCLKAPFSTSREVIPPEHGCDIRT